MLNRITVDILRIDWPGGQDTVNRVARYRAVLPELRKVDIGRGEARANPVTGSNSRRI
jgi:hypothetical protein